MQDIQNLGLDDTDNFIVVFAYVMDCYFFLLPLLAQKIISYGYSIKWHKVYG